MVWIVSLSFIFVGALALAFWVRKIVQDTEKRMQTAFQSLSYEMMERNSRSFLDLAKTALEKTQEAGKSELEIRHKSFESLVEPLKESIRSISEQQRELEKKRESSYASLNKQIESMVQGERLLRQETANLSSALKSPPVRGAWGQVHLRRVVELAGLLNQCDFQEQTSFENQGKLLRPDLIVHLPGDRQIIVDAKAPLNAYLEAADCQDEKQRIGYLKTHAVQVKKHLRELSQRDYWKKLDFSPEFVVLYLPAESFFSAAVQVDPGLIELGAEQNIIIATPTTLIAILRAVAHSWKQEALSKNAEQIALLGRELHERLQVLSEHWSKVGKSLSSSVEAYNHAIASMESRVLVTARKLKEHGAAPIGNKELLTLEPIDKLVRSEKL